MLNNSTKEVNLLGRDFGGLRLNLIDFAKQYYPNTYNAGASWKAVAISMCAISPTAGSALPWRQGT